jgi:hypothetical protein
MGRVVFGGWMVRYPLGGNLSWGLQWMLGAKRLGHDVYMVERASWENECYDPVRAAMTDDCRVGAASVDALLRRFGLGESWAFADLGGTYHGMSKARVRDLLASCDAFVDLGTHGAWLDELSGPVVRVLVDGEPGYTQMTMESRHGDDPREGYDVFFTNGADVGSAHSSAPAAGKRWHGVFNPVVADLFDCVPAEPEAPFTTVMNWRAHERIEYDGTVYGQKDVEFAAFADLPRRVSASLELAAAGLGHSNGGPSAEDLSAQGWGLVDPHTNAGSFDSFASYIRGSRGEFTVCKNVFVATSSGWFSDRSAAYLASGRPVVMQDTGFSRHLPCGDGLFAVSNADEAAAAIEEIDAHWAHHSRAAREIAEEHLDASRVLPAFFDEIGVAG